VSRVVLPRRLCLAVGFVLPLRLGLALRFGLPLKRRLRVALGGRVGMLLGFGGFRRFGLARRLGLPAAFVYASILGLSRRPDDPRGLGGSGHGGAECNGKEPTSE
jgi:hypothetical protein